MPEMFHGLEDSDIVGEANFKVDGEGKMFEDAKELRIGGGSFLTSGEDGAEMFKRLENSKLTNGKFVAEGKGKMFEKSKGLIIGGGNYTSVGSSPRKSKNTPYQQAHKAAQAFQFLGPSFPIPAPYDPTATRQPALQPQSVPATSIRPTYQSGAAFGTSVPLTYTRTVPVLPSEAQDYFPNYDVPNHQTPKDVVQGPSSTNSVAAPMEMDANNEDPSESDEEEG